MQMLYPASDLLYLLCVLCGLCGKKPAAHGEAASADMLRILTFEQAALPVPAEEMVDSLLERVHRREH